MTETPLYQVIATVQVNRFNQALQQAESGTEVTAHWLNPDTYVKVFVKDGYVNADNIDRLIRAKGAELTAIHQLGG